uniref:Uncharacterized protein n=1 Tax=Ailuropoda melanoleuca TaxID=9646 RepID=A0A7N5JI80_AILME
MPSKKVSAVKGAVKGEPKGSARLSVKPTPAKVERKPKKRAGKAKPSGMRKGTLESWSCIY